MKNFDLENFGTQELTIEEKKNANGGFLIALLICSVAYGIGYFIGRAIGGDPVQPSE